MRKAILLISLILLASSAVADEARKPLNGIEGEIDRGIPWPGHAPGDKIDAQGGAR